MPEHLVEVALVYGQSIALELLRRQRGSLFLAHGRQLRLVAYEHEPAIVAIVNKAHEVVEHAARAESAFPGTAVAYHGSLVDHEQGVSVHVEVEVETATNARERLFPVDGAVDGRGLHAAAEREHFGGAPCGGHEHEALAE